MKRPPSSLAFGSWCRHRAWLFQWRWTGTAHRRRVQERLYWYTTLYWIYEYESTLADVQILSAESFLLRGGGLLAGVMVHINYVHVRMRYCTLLAARKSTLDIACTFTDMYPVERLYYKRPILCLASSKILTSNPPSPPCECATPAFGAGGGHTRSVEKGWGGGGVNILEDARHCSVLYICKDFVMYPIDGAHLSLNFLSGSYSS